MRTTKFRRGDNVTCTSVDEDDAPISALVGKHGVVLGSDLNGYNQIHVEYTAQLNNGKQYGTWWCNVNHLIHMEYPEGEDG